MSEVQEAICWSGPATVIVFVIGSGDTPLPRETFHLQGMAPDDFLPFPLQSAPEPLDRLGVVSYDLTFDDTALDLREYTRAVLRRLCADGRAVAWAAYEGSFHFDHLLTPDIAEQVYGYCVSGFEPVVEWDGDALRGDDWKRRIAEVRAAVDRLTTDAA
ncbi:hypothetical protein [Streptomyces yangpuensis]